MQKSIVTSIGPAAISEKDPMIILFGEQATEDIRQVAVIQKMTNGAIFHLKKADHIVIGKNNYTITTIGKLANENLSSIGHVTLIFGDAPKENRLENAFYLSPSILPEIKEGTEIEYIQK